MLRTISFFGKHYLIFLFLIVLVSYGQILGMNVWKDDNAIFFKFDHVNEETGFFGKGVLGSGPYRFSMTPYYPIYKIFGNTSIVPYYILILFFYFISTLCVYYLFGKMISPKTGKVSSFLFASGFIASEGFYWLANAMFAHLAILSLFLILFFYYRYSKAEKLYNYLLAVIFYFMSSALFPLRTMYFIGIIIAFELIYLGFRKFPKSLLVSLVRIFPFAAIFHYYFTSQLDSRALSVNDFITAVFLKGEVYKLFSFFTSLSNLVIYDYLMSSITNTRLAAIISIALLSTLYFIIFKKIKRGILFTIGSIALTVAWYYSTKTLFSSPNLSLTSINFLEIFYGGVICYLLLLLFLFVGSEIKRHVLFLTIFLFTSIAAYSAYAPTAFFKTTHHYFTNSFFAVAGLMALVYVYLRSKKNFWSHAGATLIIIWGIANLSSSIYFENKIINNRSIPAFNFYNSLKANVPKINKGDLLYFDINNNAQDYFANAFSVSSMPETTAIAWRYGIDRYDFGMVTDFDELLFKLAKGEAGIDNVYSFYFEKRYFNKSGLINTTNLLRDSLKGGSAVTPLQIKQDSPQLIRLTGIVSKPVSPLLLTVKAKVLPIKKINFPNSNMGQKQADLSLPVKEKMVDYLLARQDYYKSASATSLSQWKFQEIPNIVDNNLDTSWRGHRIYWHEKRHEQVIIDLGAEKRISKILWTNWNHTLTPTSYTIDVSQDKENWEEVKRVKSGVKRQDGEVVVDDFDEAVGRYVRMDITDTLSNDAPSISELEVITSDYDGIDPKKALSFIQTPFEFIGIPEELKLLLSKMAPLLELKINWETSKGGGEKALLVGSFDNLNTYQSVIDPGGTGLNDITISIGNAPVSLEVQSATLKNLSLEEIKKLGLIKEFVEN